ncbi:hypothetical protein [Microcoleus sp. FACHB-672]|uniref:hypothetical protein n=1 Tax=Microcoleus sp. FACHB-672 TaxID=2692825 RepID=UPI0016870A91|nr:hypothetical protein [Microcoleus sp. FACHB-672]MBD2041226.1 hypothetical protein [Microcoleus sp. FACHB-672]
MTPAEFEYLIRKTVTYLEFHSDDSAKEIAVEWRKILAQIKQMKKKKVKMEAKLESKISKPDDHK